MVSGDFIIANFDKSFGSLVGSESEPYVTLYVFNLGELIEGVEASVQVDEPSNKVSFSANKVIEIIINL